VSERSGPFARAKDGITIAVRVSPGASREHIGEIMAEADGGGAIKVSVTAAPEGGKANDAVIRLLAKAWRVPKTSLSVVSGHAARRKTIHAAGNGEALFQQLSDWMRKRNA
jgi:hypothetical protein